MLKDIVGYEGLYQISDKGEVFSVPRKGSLGGKMKTHLNVKGYEVLGLCKDGHQSTVTVHRLVAEAFIPNPDNLPQVNHKDENKLNNCVDNLEWCTNEYNHDYGTRTKKTGRPVRCIETGIVYPGSAWAARELNVDQSTVTKCCKNPNRTTGGLHWEYVD